MFRLTITPKADDRTSEILIYLHMRWGTTVQNNFASELKRCLRIIKNNPYSFCTIHAEPELRKCVVTPLNILYYTIKDKEIIVISIEDTRMNPENIRLI